MNLLWITLPIALFLTAGITSGSKVVPHVIRSARPGDQCSWRRDVVLLVDQTSSNAYIQCRRVPGNGSVGVWKRIVCGAGRTFSYSRQKCLVVESKWTTVVPNSGRDDGNGSSQVANETQQPRTTTAESGTSVHDRTEQRETALETTEAVTERIPSTRRRTTSRRTVSSPRPKISTVNRPRTVSTSNSTTLTSSTSTTTTTPTRTTTTMSAATTTMSTTPRSGRLGFPCGPSMECTDTNTICVSGICNCDEGHELKARGRYHHCVLLPTTTTTMPATVPHYPVPIEGHCDQSAGLVCRAVGSECCADGLECVDSICQYPQTQATTLLVPQCPDGWILLDLTDHKYCAPTMLKFGESCFSPLQTCTGGSVCEEGRCGCSPGHVPVDNFCVPMAASPNQRRALGTTCASSVQCVWAGAVCQQGHCVCPPGTNAVHDTCQLPGKSHSVLAGGYCTDSTHCTSGLACVHGICVCLPGYGCEGSVQPSPPGSSCAFSRYCSAHSSCRNGWCVCSDKAMTMENGECILGSPGYHVTAATATSSQPSVQRIQPSFISQDQSFQPAPVLPGLLPNGIGRA